MPPLWFASFFQFWNLFGYFLVVVTMVLLRRIFLWLWFASSSLLVRCGLPPPSAWRFSLFLRFRALVCFDLLQLFRDESWLLLLLLLGLLLRPRLPSLCGGVWSCSPR